MNQKQREGIGYLIRYELRKGIHTYHICLCERHGCRGANCWECLLEMLETGKVLNEGKK